MKLWYQVRLVTLGNDPISGGWGPMGEGWSLEEAIAMANPLAGMEYQLVFRTELRMVMDE